MMLFLKNVVVTHPRLVSGQTKPNADGCLGRIHDGIVVDVSMVTQSDGFVVGLVSAVERIDWLFGKQKQSFTSTHKLCIESKSM